MLTASTAFILSTALFWCSADGFTDHAIDCCLTTTGQFLPRHIAVSYTMQEKSACRIPATVFITRKNKKICSPPLEDARYPWVKKLITHLDNLNALPQ
ncbi:C-C motif chemokine 19a.2 [Electrophorus electricus]|uniref:C-C motif chemokine 19a.2 n=1 Tax=Electrophorus electricus TaxID=8005 RepID=UPI000F0A1138|nr:C-C motif chemokine 19a.2 [Electrophorus electricus]